MSRRLLVVVHEEQLTSTNKVKRKENEEQDGLECLRRVIVPTRPYLPLLPITPASAY